MVMDMDVLKEGASEPASRVGSPPLAGNSMNGKDLIKEDSAIADDDEADDGKRSTKTGPTGKEEPAPMKKMGNLMKELKQDVQQGGMEFDMGNFF